MENRDLIAFTRHIQKQFGDKGSVKQIKSIDLNLPDLYFFIFHNFPDKNLMTIVSYGLCESKHPQWHAGRPELLLCVESKDESWVDSLGAVINELRGKKSFSYGSVYLAQKPLGRDTNMEAFVIFSCGFLNVEKRTFEPPSKTVYLNQAYPIYKGEGELIKKKGFEAFWEDKRFKDPYDVRREDVSL